MTELHLDVDRSSPVPLYHQLALQIESAIDRGELRPGQRLATELELAHRHGLSRPTVRQAIQELVRKGLLVRRRGVGTQVVRSQVRRPVELSSLFDDLVRAGRTPRTEVLELTEATADPEVAAALDVPDGSAVSYVARLRWAGEEPLAVMRNWLPGDLVTLDRDTLTRDGLYAVLRRAGVEIRVATQRIGARAATAAEGRLLGGRKGSPLLTMERTAYDHTGRAVELGQHVYRAESYTFEVTLVER